MWIAWSLTFLGGLAVIVAVVLLAADPCAGLEASPPAGCPTTGPSTTMRVLALGGTVLAVVGGLAATWLTIRRRG